jgi:hypothetical protein
MSLLIIGVKEGVLVKILPFYQAITENTPSSTVFAF